MLPQSIHVVSSLASIRYLNIWRKQRQQQVLYKLLSSGLGVYKKFRFFTHISEGAMHFSYFYGFWFQKCGRNYRGGTMK
jgi:hypothetical protein